MADTDLSIYGANQTLLPLPTHQGCTGQTLTDQ